MVCERRYSAIFAYQTLEGYLHRSKLTEIKVSLRLISLRKRNILLPIKINRHSQGISVQLNPEGGSGYHKSSPVSELP